MQRPAKPLTPVRFRIQPPLNIMKIGIIGYGFVGKALSFGLKDDVEICKIDPKLNSEINDLIEFKPDAVFICVPTPMKDDASQDISLLKSVISEFQSLDLNCLVIIKSTVLPNYIEEIESLIPDFIYNPEFLREKYADQDFINSELIIFGGNKVSAKYLANIYKNFTKCICEDYIYTDIKAASIMKYTINSFLATKVSFFNEINALFKKSGTNETWNNFISALVKDKRIGNSHMDVPGHDGRLGFGGACLPKDSNAFLYYSESLGQPLNILKTAINTNNIIRASYNEPTRRELEQNIKFKGDS